MRLDALDAATDLRQLARRDFDFHPLRGKPQRYSNRVNGPWCVTFEWRHGRAYRVEQEHLALSKSEAARRMKISRPSLDAVLDGESAVTADMALRFAAIGGGEPSLLNMQAAHDLWRACQRLERVLATIRHAA